MSVFVGNNGLLLLLLLRLHSRCLELKDWHPSEVEGYNNGRCLLE